MAKMERLANDIFYVYFPPGNVDITLGLLKTLEASINLI